MTPGERFTVAIEKPAAGGRMIARHDRAVVLVSAAIPGEEVEVEVERVQRGTAWARTIRVMAPSPDRITPVGDWTCGGNVLAHVRYPRQLALKRDIVRDAFVRIGRLTVPEDLPVAASPVDGYRMRARLHVADGRIGFFREGTHEVCDAAPTGQLLPETVDVLRELAARVRSARAADIEGVELSENCPADGRAVHLLLRERARAVPALASERVAGVTGMSCSGGHRFGTRTLWGSPEVTDTLAVPSGEGALTVTLTRHVRAFFQGNRFQLVPLVAAVTSAVPPGRVLDLYAGVGLFSVALAARGDTTVVAVEGDRTAALDLTRNAAAATGEIVARMEPVESFLAEAGAAAPPDTVLVDPPRTGLSREAVRGVLSVQAARVVYVSCDVATLARDARVLVDAGYRLGDVRSLDLFPNTAHVETVAVFDR